MRIVWKYIVVCILSVNSGNIHAQLIEDLNAYVQKVRIALVDEFFARFNGTEMHPDLPLEKEGEIKI